MKDAFAPWFDWSHPLNKVARKRPTIDELEAILQREDDVEIEILPNGEIRAKDTACDGDRAGRKPLTMRENLGGEYGCDPRGGFELCERCGGEGRLYIGHPNDPNPRDVGECPDCEGTCREWHDDEMPDDADEPNDDFLNAPWGEHSQFGVGA